MTPSVLLLLALALQEPAPQSRDEAVERELARIEYALVALRSSGDDAPMRERAVQSRALQRDEHPQDLLGALVFLASAESDFVTGQTLAVDGGNVNT